MQSSVWLDLKSTAPGLPGPYLQEFNAAYRHLEDSSLACSKLIIIIGGDTKRRTLATSFSVNSQENVISLSLLDYPHALVAIDCELHLKKDLLSRIQGGPCPGHYRHHLLTDNITSPSEIAIRLYGEVLIQFCSVAVLFVADFPEFSQLSKLLAIWLRHLMLNPIYINRMPFRVLLFFGDSDGGSEEQQKGVTESIWFEAILTLQKQLQAANPLHFHSFSDLKRKALRHMSLEILSNLPGNAFRKILLSKSDHTAGYAGRHYKFLLNAAIRHFAKNEKDPFNPILAYQTKMALPADWRKHMVDFVRIAEQTKSLNASMIASALLLNMYSRGMYCKSVLIPVIKRADERYPNLDFDPSTVFQYLFEDFVIQLQNSTKTHDLTWMVRHEFHRRAKYIISSGISRVQAHLETLGAARYTSLSVSSLATCCFCLIREPSHTSSCRHRLCSLCVMACGKMQDPWRFHVLRCPLCHASNQSPFLLKPRTAGARVLEISGANPENTLQFLSDLQHKVGLTTMPLREYFDIVIASDCGRVSTRLNSVLC